MAKHLVDLGEGVLGAARAAPGTATIKDAVNESLRPAAARREPRVSQALEVLAAAALEERSAAWRRGSCSARL